MLCKKRWHHLTLDFRHLFCEMCLCRLRQEVVQRRSRLLLTVLFIFHLRHTENREKKQVFYIKRMCAQRGALQKVTQMCCWGGAALGSSHLTLQPCHLLHQLRLKSLRKCRKQRRRQFLLSALLVLDLQSHTHRHTLWHQWQSLFYSNLFFYFTFLYCWTDSEIISRVWSPDSGSVRPAWRVECPEFQPWWSIKSCRPPDLHSSYT